MSEQASESVHEILCRLEGEWKVPRHAVHDGKLTALALSVQTDPAAGGPPPGISAPPDVLEFWRWFECVRLFEDRRSSQWGLVLVPPRRALGLTEALRRERSGDALDGDLVLGEFLGDSDLLLVRADPKANDYGSVIVALPLDPRPDWYRVGSSLTDFLRQYASAEGAKFWEKSAPRTGRVESGEA